MNDGGTTGSGRWADGLLPPNVRFGEGTLASGESVFQRFKARGTDALVAGSHCTLEGVHFAVGAEGRVRIGDWCCLTNCILLCEAGLTIGDYVMIGWNATIADTDFQLLRRRFLPSRPRSQCVKHRRKHPPHPESRSTSCRS